MRKYYSVILVLCSLFIHSGAQAQNFLEKMIAEGLEAEEVRLSEAPKLAPTLIPRAKIQSQLGSYLVAQLGIKQEEETNKKKLKKIKKDLSKIKKDLKKLDAGISGWERKDYSSKLDKLIKTSSKHTKRYQSIVEVEQNRLAEIEKAEQNKIAARKKAEQNKIAARKKAEQNKIAARKKAKQNKIAAYKTMCEGSVSDDPFAAFDLPDTEDRLKLTAEIDRKKIKLQATEKGCLWEENAKDSSILPELVDASLFQQNPKNTSQFIYSGLRDSKLILDFAKYQCLSQKKDGTKQKIACYDSSVIASTQITSTKVTTSKSNGVSSSSSITEITCSALYKEFQANEFKTIRKYKDKSLVITGNIKNIQADYSDNAQIVLATGTGAFSMSSCTLSPSPSNQDFASELQIGTFVKLKCSDISEVIGSPTASKCTLAN